MPKKEPPKVRGVFEKVKGSGRWWICFHDQFGQKHREFVGMRSKAIEVYQQRKTEIRQGKFVPADIKQKHVNCIVSEIIDDRLKVAENLKTFDDESSRLEWWRSRIGDLASNSICPQDIEAARRALIEKKEPRLRPASVNRYLAALKAAFSYAVLNGKMNKNPVKEVKMEKENNQRIRYLTFEEEKRLFAALPQKYHSLVTVALHTGLRKSEQFSLQWGDVDFLQGQIRVRESKSGKGRVVAMNKTVMDTLRELSKVRLFDNPYVFPGDKKGSRRTDLPKYWEQYLKQANIENFHWHDLRHSFASRLVMAGVDLYSVKELLGHHDFKMTQRYAHLSPGHLKAAVRVLDSEVTPEVTPTKIANL